LTDPNAEEIIMDGYQARFSDAEWSVLVGLPQSVVWAASAIEPDSAKRSMLESEAGLRAIADGRGSSSKLVASVATQIIEQVAGDPDLGEEPVVVVSPAEPEPYVEDCLNHARQAMAMLTDRADGAEWGEGDAGAYKHWLVTIAEDVVAAAPSGGVLGIGGTQVTAAEQDFVHRLTVALGD
jgi:hypothetical protein